MEPLRRAPSVVYPARPPQYHGFCWGCCHPAASCCCGWKQCRKEAKELVVGGRGKTDSGLSSHTVLSLLSDEGETFASTRNLDITNEIKPAEDGERIRKLGADRAEAFIGGSCCVHLSVEYMPISLKADISAVRVIVADSENTKMTWEQRTGGGSVYQVRENIITTKPGALLVVEVSEMVARVRWCEVFSC